MSQLVNFSISTPSRHPANQNGYDPDKHCYHENYVNPRFWVLDLFALPLGLSEDSGGEAIIPKNIALFQWTVKQVDGTFFETIEKGRSPSMLRTRVQIPEPGEYEITLRVNLTNGEHESSTLNYRLRDFLIVSIGDSFAAGQGNPDVTAIPSSAEKAICEATTLMLVITKLQDAVNKFRKKLKEETTETIEEYLPFIGKIVVAAVNEVEDMVGFVKSKTADLKDAVVDIVKDTGGAIVEGAEEVASWFGVGNGGESGEIISRPAGWQEPKAYRSYRSGHSLAARQIETQTPFGADRITFLSFARSGSEINDGLLGPRTVNPKLFSENLAIDGWVKNRGQIQEAKDTVLNRRIDALIVTISINDLGFSSLVSDSILYASGEKRKERIEKAKEKLKNQVPANFHKLKEVIDSQLRPRKVFITEYPIGVFKDVTEGKSCGVLTSKLDLDLDGSDAKGLAELGRLLNQTIRAKADEFGWVLIDGIERGFDGHGYCAKQPYFVSAEESCRNQGDFEGMLHPNKLGHEVTRDCIALALRRELLTPEENWLEAVLSVMMKRGGLLAPQTNWLEAVLNVMMR